MVRRGRYFLDIVLDFGAEGVFFAFWSGGWRDVEVERLLCSFLNVVEEVCEVLR